MVTSVALALTRPRMTRDAPTSSATLMIVARVTAVPEGSCRRSKAASRSSRPTTATPRPASAAVKPMAVPSPSQPTRGSNLSWANGTTSVRPPLLPGPCAGRLVPATSSIRLGP